MIKTLSNDFQLLIKMYLRFFLNEQGKRVYTFKFHDEEGKPTLSAHPGKFHSLIPPSPFLTRRRLPEGTHEVQGEIQPFTDPAGRHGALNATMCVISN